MRRTFFARAVALISSLAGTPALADQPTYAPYTILSEGASTCGEFLAEPQKQVPRVMWVLGYISGRNREAPQNERFAGSSFQMPATVAGWLQSYCANHALDVMAKAADELRADFLRHERAHR